MRGDGDFFALLPERPVLPLFGPSHSPPVLEATTVFAFHCAEGVIVAGDRRATSGTVVFSDKTEKILELDAHSLMAIAGVPAAAFEMARTLQTAFEFYRRSQLQPMSLAAKVRALSKLLRDNLPATLQGVGTVAPIFAGLEVADAQAKPVIFYYDPLGATFEATTFAASGSGALTIRSILHFLENWGRPRPQDMPLDQATALAHRLLLTAAEFDTATGGVRPEKRLFATIKLLNREGIRTLQPEELERHWQQAAAS